MNERSRALDLLRRIERESLFASIVIRNETPFVRAAVLGVLRWRSKLDAIIRSLAPRSIDASVLDVLRLGAYQLLFMDMPSYAAVAETVALAPKHARGFANAILRRVADQRFTEPADLAAQTAHPAWLIERWSGQFGAERAAAIARANQELSYPDVLSLRGVAPPEAVPSQLVERVWKLHGSSASLDRDDFWPMDEGSAVIAAIAARAGARLLDIAAAPGGKSLYARTAGRNVVSSDVSVTRLMPLRHRGIPLVVGDGRNPPFRRAFDVVLLDAPCSATGTIRKNPELKWRLREADLQPFAQLQKELLRAALTVARDVCIYSTCSLEPEENDGVVAEVGAERMDIAEFVPPAVMPWVENGVLRLTPESGADGFTAFALRGLATR